MIALDLDGTLTNAKKEITPRTKQALLAAQAQGVRIVLASGRPTYGIAQLADELEIGRHGGYVLAYNGGVIIDWSNRHIVYEQILDEALVPQIYNAAMEAGMQILTYQGEAIAATSISDEYVRHEAFINKMPLVEYDDFLSQVVYPINKCLIVGAPAPLHELEQQLAKAMEGRISVYRSADFFLECVPLGIDKAQSLDRLIASLGIDRKEMIACGDGYNDLSMIRFAGLGVAMNNANDDIRAQADYVTCSNEEDGVAHVVEKFVLS